MSQVCFDVHETQPLNKQQIDSFINLLGEKKIVERFSLVPAGQDGNLESLLDWTTAVLVFYDVTKEQFDAIYEIERSILDS
jgi:hypothetical protein